MELRSHRLSWRFCAALYPLNSDNPGRFSKTALAISTVIGIILSIPLGLVLGGPGGMFVGPPVALLAIPLLFVLVGARSGMWWASGAGLPVLVVRDGEVRGRLRPVYADEKKAFDPNYRTWWDFTLPADELLAVRVARSDRAPKHEMIALDLPTRLRDELLNRPELAKLTKRFQDEVDTPAAWAAGAMYPPGRRSAAVHALVSALREAGAPMENSGH
jgi:hypothetical protein